MTGLEIVVLLAGLVFIIASFFFGGHQTAAGDSGEETNAAILKIKEAAVFQETELKQRVQQILEVKSQEAVSETEDRLSRISNDKIMAIDEYSTQVLEKIENNNQEVIFLYDMFQKKEEEMKSTMNKMEQTRRENKELFDRLEELKKAKARSQKNASAGVKTSDNTKAAKSSKISQNSSTEKDSTAVGLTEKKKIRSEQIDSKTVNAAAYPTQADGLSQAAARGTQDSLPAEQEEEYMELNEEEKKEKVLELHRSKKTIKEISKQLGMGQGEVKLIIDLYGK